MKITTLRRGFGEWPPHGGFGKLPKETQQAFFANSDGLNAKDLIKKAEDVFHIKEELGQKSYMNGGEFLPLAVWATRGFDANQIAQRSAESSKREHPVLGMTFRVKMHSQGERGEENIRTRQVLSTRAKRAKTQCAAGDGADGADLTTDADLQTQPEGSKQHAESSPDKNSSGGSSSSSSSSSSSGKKQARNHKKKSHNKSKKSSKKKKSQ